MAASLFQSASSLTAQAASSTRYLFLGSGPALGPSTTEANRTNSLRAGGVLSRLYINVLSNDRGTSTLRSRKATANGAQVVTITASTTGEFQDLSNTDTVTAGEDWHYSLVTGAGGIEFLWSVTNCLFTPTSNTYTHAIAANSTLSAASVTRFLPVFGLGGQTATESQVAITARGNATAKHFFLYVSANARSTTSTFGSRKNGGAGAMTVTVTASSTGVFEDTSNTDSLASGDTFNGYITTGTGTGSVTWQGCGFDLETADGTWYAIAGDMGGQTVAAAATTYVPVAGDAVPNGTEGVVAGDFQAAATGSNLSVAVSANTVSATSTVKLRKNAADGSQSVSITASTTGVFTDAVNSDPLVASDSVCYVVTAGGSGTSLTYRWMGMKLSPTAAAGGQPTMRRWLNIPGMTPGPRSFGRVA